MWNVEVWFCTGSGFQIPGGLKNDFRYSRETALKLASGFSDAKKTRIVNLYGSSEEVK